MGRTMSVNPALQALFSVEVKDLVDITEDYDFPIWETDLEALDVGTDTFPEEEEFKPETDPHSVGWFLSLLNGTRTPSEEEQKGWLLIAQQGKAAIEKLAERLGQDPKELRLAARKKALGETQATPLGVKNLDRESQRLWEQAVQGEVALMSLVEGNLRLIVHVAKRYVGSGVHLVDLVSQGALGIMEAVDRFDMRLGYRFSTYAYWWVRQRVSRGARDLYSTTEDKGTLSLDEEIGDGVYLVDFLAAPDNLAVEAEEKRLREQLWEHLPKIGNVHALALGLRTGLVTGEPLSVAEVARLMEMERKEVEQILEEAKRRAWHLLKRLGAEE